MQDANESCILHQCISVLECGISISNGYNLAAVLIPFSVEFEPIVILNPSRSLSSNAVKGSRVNFAKDLTARDSSADLRMTEKAHFQIKMV